MSPSSLRVTLLSSLVLCAAAVGPVAAAHASDASLRSTVASYNSKLIKDEGKVLEGVAQYDKNHASGPMVKAMKHEVADLHSLARKLSAQSPSTTKGAKAKSEITKGLNLVARAYSLLVKDVQGAHGKPVAAAKVLKAVNAAKKGRSSLQAGAKLLA